MGPDAAAQGLPWSGWELGGRHARRQLEAAGRCWSVAACAAGEAQSKERPLLLVVVTVAGRPQTYSTHGSEAPPPAQLALLTLKPFLVLSSGRCQNDH